MNHIGDVQEDVSARRITKVRELVSQLSSMKLSDDITLEEALDSVCNVLLNVKNLSENGNRFLELVALVFALSKEVSDSYAHACVKRSILPALYFCESSAIYEIQSLHHLENQYVPPQIPLHTENNPFSLKQENKCSNNSDSDSDSDNENIEIAKCETSLPPMIQPYQQLENLYRTLRSIRQNLIYFEVSTILSNPEDDIFLASKIPRLLTFLALESAHRQGILPNLQCLVEPSNFQTSVHIALEIIRKKLIVSDQGPIFGGKERFEELRDTKAPKGVHGIELDSVKLESIELSIMQLHNGYESVSITIPIDWLDIEIQGQNSLEFLEKWKLPSSLIKIWTKRTSSTLEGFDDSTTTLSNTLKKIYGYEEVGKLRRWADVSRMKARFIVLPLLSKRVDSHSFLVADLTELKRAYFVNGLAGGIWSAFWTIVLLFTLAVVFLQIVSAESFLSLVTVWNSKDKYAITAILYESANSNNVMIAVYCISMLPLIWGLYKGVKSMLSITNDPKEEFREILRFLKSQIEGQETSGWFLREVWWDRLRWQLPWYMLRNQLEGLMELTRWDARISAADRFDSLSILILLYQSRGGETRSVVSGFIAEIADIMRVDVPNIEQSNQGGNHGSLLAGELQTSDEDALIIRATKVKAIEFLLSMGEFPVTEWRHAKWYARPSLLWHYLEGRYLNWWIGLSSSLFEFAFFFILTIVLVAMSLLFVSTAVEAIREYAACPQMKGIAFTGPAPYVGKFDSDCWSATMKEFGRIPGQPAETLVSALPKFYFSKETKQSFTLDISGKYLDGDQVGKLIDGFRESGFIITRLIARQNSIGTLTRAKPGFLTTFSNSLEKLSQSLQVLDLSECGLGEGSSSFVKYTSEWQRFYDVLGGLRSLKTLNLGGNALGLGLVFSSESGEKMSTLFLNSLSKLTGVEDLDMSSNVLAYCDYRSQPDVCIDIGRAIVSMKALKYLKLRNNDFYAAAEGIKGMIDMINIPGLLLLDLSENPTKTMQLKHSVLSLLSRHPKLEHLDVAHTQLFLLLDTSHDDFAQRFSAGFGPLAGTLKHLNLSQTTLVATTISENFLLNALDTLSTFEKLEILDLDGNDIGYYCLDDKVPPALTNMLAHLSSLREIHVHENYLGFDLWNPISNHLKSHPGLMPTPYLVSKEDIEHFVSVSLLGGRLSLRNRLISGFAYDVKTKDETEEIFDEVFNTIARQSKTITSLDLSGVGLNLHYALEMYLVGEGLQTIANSGKTLQELNLADNFISSCSNVEALQSFKKGIIAHSKTLKHLDLSGRGSQVSVPFAQMLHDVFLELEQLEFLDLSRNTFGAIQSIYHDIGDGLTHLQSLKKLVIGRNLGTTVHGPGAMHFFDSISKLGSLQELDAHYMSLGSYPTILPSFSNIFSIPSLRGLYLQGNILLIDVNPRDELLSFLQGMKQAKNLRTLDITDNQLGLLPFVETKVIEAIKSFEHLCTLYLSGNQFGFDPESKGLGDLIGVLPRLIGYDLRGVAGVDWTEHAGSISETISRDLRSKCESRICRGSKVATEPHTCPI